MKNQAHEDVTTTALNNRAHSESPVEFLVIILGNLIRLLFPKLQGTEMLRLFILSLKFLEDVFIYFIKDNFPHQERSFYTLSIFTTNVIHEFFIHLDPILLHAWSMM